ncbi:MAG: hypothetical protein JWN52_5953 [Actinomycetia bacterium]|nr:hypothetical protein [Actinomycetes bacterium]
MALNRYGAISAFAAGLMLLTGCNGITTTKAPAAATSSSASAAPTTTKVPRATRPSMVASATPADGPLVGPGTECGLVSNAAGTAYKLVVAAGHISCAHAIKVLHIYYAASTPKQGSGRFASFSGWTCASQSIAEMQGNGVASSCTRAGITIAAKTP